MLMTGNTVELSEPDLIEEVLCGEEVDAVTDLQGAYAERDCKMRFANAGWSEQHHIFSPFDERECLQFVDNAAIERGLCVEIEGIEAFENREVRQLRTNANAPFLSCCKLIAKDTIEKLHV